MSNRRATSREPSFKHQLRHISLHICPSKGPPLTVQRLTSYFFYVSFVSNLVVCVLFMRPLVTPSSYHISFNFGTLRRTPKRRAAAAAAPLRVMALLLLFAWQRRVHDGAGAHIQQTVQKLIEHLFLIREESHVGFTNSLANWRAL